MQYSLRTLLILLAIGPPVLAIGDFLLGLLADQLMGLLLGRHD